jgi:CMP-N-acetylneuraminic acid synthetase
VRDEMIFVSTDSDSIAVEALNSGAQVPFLRPDELATDASPEVLSWKHLLGNIDSLVKTEIETMIVLPVTSPMRRTKDIDNALKLFESEARKNPYFNMLEENSNGFLELSKLPKNRIARRQDTPSVWEMNNAIYIAKIEYVKELSTLLQGKILGYEMPAEYSIDIDSPLDVEYLRFLEGWGKI